MPKRTTDYHTSLLADLQDPAEAALYLNAAMDDSEEMFLVALRDVVEAHHISRVAQEAEISREHVYRMLSANGNPRYDSLLRLLRTLGLRLAIETTSESVGPSTPVSPVTSPLGLTPVVRVTVADVPMEAKDTKSGQLILHDVKNSGVPRRPVTVGGLYTRAATAA
jgi:probable addiction module antidote protein